MDTTTKTGCTVRIINYRGNAEVYITSDDTNHGQPIYSAHLNITFFPCTDEDGGGLEECEGEPYGFCNNRDYLCMGALLSLLKEARTVEEIESLCDEFSISCGVIEDNR